MLASSLAVLVAMSIEALEKASAEQGAAVAALKKEKAPKDKVDAAVAELLKRKAALKEGLEAAVVEAKAAGDSARLACSEGPAPAHFVLYMVLLCAKGRKRTPALALAPK